MKYARWKNRVRDKGNEEKYRISELSIDNLAPTELNFSKGTPWRCNNV